MRSDHNSQAREKLEQLRAGETSAFDNPKDFVRSGWMLELAFRQERTSERIEVLRLLYNQFVIVRDANPAAQFKLYGQLSWDFGQLASALLAFLEQKTGENATCTVPEIMRYVAKLEGVDARHMFLFALHRATVMNSKTFTRFESEQLDGIRKQLLENYAAFALQEQSATNATSSQAKIAVHNIPDVKRIFEAMVDAGICTTEKNATTKFVDGLFCENSKARSTQANWNAAKTDGTSNSKKLLLFMKSVSDHLKTAEVEALMSYLADRLRKG